MNNQIPKRLLPEFMSFMADHDHDGITHSQWLITLELAAQEFINTHDLIYVDKKEALKQYLGYL